MRRARPSEPAHVSPDVDDIKRSKRTHETTFGVTPLTPAPRTPTDGDRFSSPPRRGPAPAEREREQPSASIDDARARDRHALRGILHRSTSPAMAFGFTRRLFSSFFGEDKNSNASSALREERAAREEMHARAMKAEATSKEAQKTIDALRTRVIEAEAKLKEAKEASTSVASAATEGERTAAAMRLISTYFSTKRCDSCGFDELLATARAAMLDANDVMRALAILCVDTSVRQSSFMVTVHQI